LNEDQRAELQALTRSRHGSAAVVRRARCILMWAAAELGDISAMSAHRIWKKHGIRPPIGCAGT